VVTQMLKDQQSAIIHESSELMSRVEHIERIIQAQQKFGKLSSLFENVDLGKAVEDAVGLAESALNLHMMKIERHIQPDAFVWADRHKLLQILVNLIQNAAQACRNSEVRLVSIEVREQNDAFEIGIRDTGHGISPEAFAHLFQFGFTTRVDGHGTGLHASANAAQEMNGTLTAQSDGEGAGSLFVLSLKRGKTA